MSLTECFRMAVGALLVHKLRSFLTLLGVIIGVGAVIAMVAVGAGARVRLDEQIRSLGTNLLMVMPGSPRATGVPPGRRAGHTLTEADGRAIVRESAQVESVAAAVSGRARVVHGNRNWQTTVIGTTADYFGARDWPLASGRSFTAGEETGAAKVAVLGASVARRLFPGHPDPAGEIIRIRKVPFTVIGVLEAKGFAGTGSEQDDVVFAPLSAARLRLGSGQHRVSRQSVNYLLVKVRAAEAMPLAERQIAALLRSRHRLPATAPDDFRIHNPTAIVRARQGAARTVSWLLGAVASISLVVGGISIMNTMLVSVTERTREIGLRMAVGARPRDIRNQFLVESLTLCVAGGVLGAVAGVGAALLMAELGGWPVFIGVEVALMALAFSTAVGIGFGVYPAVRAARLDPVEALRAG